MQKKDKNKNGSASVKKGKKKLKDNVKKSGSKMKPSSNLKEAEAQMRRAGEKVLSTRKAIRTLNKEPQGHFNKRIVGSTSKARKSLYQNLGEQERTRDSLRGVVRGYKSKLKK